MDKPTVCFVIPCFNEESRIFREGYLSFLKAYTEVHLCFVDDGSSDQTLSLLENLRDKNPDQIQILPLDKNRGKSEAVRHGMLDCSKNDQFKVVGYLDADLATPLEEMVRLIPVLTEDENAAFCFGSRILKVGSVIERSPYRHYLGRIVATFISNILDLGVYDTQCGCKLFKTELARKVFQEPFISRWLFDVEIFFRVMEVYGRKEGIAKMREIPLLKWIDPGGSKIKMSESFKVWQDLYRINKEYKSRIPG